MNERDLFIAALQKDAPAERRAFLDEACRGDTALRERVDALLAMHERAGSFLEKAIVGPAVAQLDGPGLSAAFDGSSREVRLVQAAGADAPPGSAGPGILSGSETRTSGPTDTRTSAPIEGPGAVIGHYKLLEKIGEGGFGTVYLAEQQEPVRRKVAVKVIKLGMDTRQVIARFEAERQALAMMEHPHIAKVFDAGATDTGRPYFVMELVRGVPVTHYCDEQRVPLRERLALFTDVCHAVQHAHQKGIIHRDLKPSNVLVSRHDDKPVVKVIDFGIVKATLDTRCPPAADGSRSDLWASPITASQGLTDKTVHTEWRQLIGTPAYMSPEQAGMSDLDADTRSDIYSLGVLLYELLTGTTPFDATDLMHSGLAEMQRIIREVEPAKPSTRVSSLSEPLPQGRGVLQAAAHARDARKPDVIERSTSPTTGVVGSDESRRPSSVLDIAKHRRTDPRTLSRTLRGDLDWITMKCLEKDRTRRYETANGLAMDVGRYLAAEPVIAAPPSVAYRASRFMRRHRVGVTAAAMVVGALLVGLAGTTWGVFWALGERDQARLAEFNRSQEAARADREAAEAKRQAKETQQVADFQASQLSKIDTNLLAVRLRRDLLVEARASMERSKREEGEIAARTEQLEKLLAGANLTNVALKSLDENIFERALDTIDEQFEDQPLVKAQLLQTVADTLRELGLLDAATRPQEQALAIRHRLLGDEHPDTLRSIGSTGSLLQAKGRLSEAEPYLREALEKFRRVLGDEHADTLTSINDMGLLLKSQGKLAEAEPYYREALEKKRRVLGDEHPSALTSINHMGTLLQDQGKLAEAEGYYREALERKRRVLGDEHADTLTSINDMGLLLKCQGKLTEAEPYYREALEKYRRVLGDEHPYTLTSIGNMGDLLESQGKLAEAEPYFREALEKRRRVLGDEHPDTLNSISQMGKLLHARGRLTEAEPYFREALDTKRRVLGDDHPDTLSSISHMGSLLDAQGKLSEAEPFYREALEKHRRVLGDEHPETVASINNMGFLLQAQGKLAEAEPHYREALEKCRRALGDEHPNTLSAINNMGSLLQAQGRLAEAEPYFREALEKSRRVLGDEHPDTLTSIAWMGSLLQAQGKPAEAEPYFREALEKSRRVLGDEHPHTLGSIGQMGRVLLAQGRLAEAEPLFREALAIQRRRLPAGSPELAGALAAAASNFLKMKAYGTAEELLRECLAIREWVLPEGHPQAWLRHTAASILGEAIVGRVADELGPEGTGNESLTRLREAEELLLEAWSKLKDDPAVPPPTPRQDRKREALERIVKLYDAWHTAEPGLGYDAKAAQYRVMLETSVEAPALP